jgi:hypothetical protein
MVPGRDGDTVDDAAATWADDAVSASEWLTDPRLGADDPGLGTDAAALEWLTDTPGASLDAPGVDEAEFLPALAAIIPAVISAAPAIISAVQQLTSKPKPPAPPAFRPAQPPPAPPPAAAPSPPAPQPPAPQPPAPPAPAPQGTSAAPRPAPPPTPSAGTAQPTPSGAIDLLQQLASLLPRLADLVTRPEGREWLISSERDQARQHELSAAQPFLGRQSSAHRGTPEAVSVRAREHAGSTEGGRGEQRETESGGEAPPDGGALVGGPTGRSPPEPASAVGAVLAKPRRSDARLVPLPDPTTLNVGVSPCPTSLLVARFGRPRDLVTNECQAITSPFWEGRMVAGQVGRSRVRGHRQAVTLLGEAFAALEQADPELYARTDSGGMLCVRHVRGRPDVLSNHSLGLALDVTLDGHIDIRGDGQVQEELITLHVALGRFGIFWGAGLRPEDAVHFEVGAEVVHRWIDEGVF